MTMDPRPATPAGLATRAELATRPELTTPLSRPALPRVLLALVVVAAAWFALQAMHELQAIVGPLLLVVNLMILAHPVQAWLTRRRLPRVIGAIVSALLVFTILLTVVLALVWSILQLVAVLPDYQFRFLALYSTMVEQLERWGITETQVLDQLQGVLSPANVAGLVRSALSGVTGAVSWLAVVATIVFVVVIDSISLPERARAALRGNEEVARSLFAFARGVRRYWVVSSTFGLIVAVIDVLVLLALDVPLALVWGVLAFITNFIPNIGFVIGVIPPALMALLANDGRTALLVVILYSVVNFTIQAVIQPKFTGESVGVTATMSLLSLLLWTWVLGPLGALLALPATLLAKSLLIDPDPQLRWVNAYISSHPDDVGPADPPASHGAEVPVVVTVAEDGPDERDDDRAVEVGEDAPDESRA